MDTQPSRLEIVDLGARRLSASGIVDSHTAASFSARVDELGSDADLEIRLADVEFIDSSGLRAIVAAHQNLAQAGHQLVLRDPSPAVIRLLQITGLDDHLHTR